MMDEKDLRQLTFDASIDEVELRSRASTEIQRTDKALEAAAALAAAPPPPGGGVRGLPAIDWAATGAPELRPQLAAFPNAWNASSPLPKADVVVITWTSAEWDALHYVFSNALEPLPQSPDNNANWRGKWYPYRRNFHTIFQGLWTRRLIGAARNTAGGAPALQDGRWGSFCPVKVGTQNVLLFKSDLHVNQDGESLPLVQLVRQITAEAQPKLLLSVGTGGGVRLDDVLGDVVVTNAAMFHLGQEFEAAPFNGQKFTCKTWSPPEKHLAGAGKLVMPVAETPVQPPTAHFPNGAVIRPQARAPKIHLLPGNPILTTDFFEFGSTTNKLWEQGCCVEMDDAVIAMVCEENGGGVSYGFVRNVSDPVINGDLPRRLQVAWAVLTYQLQGFFTSYNGAIATWAMIAGTQP